MGNVYMEAEQIRYKSASYRNVQEGLDAAFAGLPEGLDERVTALETTVGDSSAGLVKDVDNLETTVGDSSAGLVKDVDDLQTTVGDSSSGLVKTVTDQGTAITGLQTVVGDNTSGLVKAVSDIEDDIEIVTISPSDFFASLPGGVTVVQDSFIKKQGKVIFGCINLQSESAFPASDSIFTIANAYASKNILNSVGFFKDRRFNPTLMVAGYFYINSNGLRLRNTEATPSCTFCTVNFIYECEPIVPGVTREEDQEPETKSAN